MHVFAEPLLLIDYRAVSPSPPAVKVQATYPELDQENENTSIVAPKEPSYQSPRMWLPGSHTRGSTSPKSWQSLDVSILTQNCPLAPVSYALDT